MTDSASEFDPRVAERAVRRWLADQFLLELVEDTEDLPLYEFDSDREWLFRLENPFQSRVGPDRYISVDKSTGEIRRL